MIQGSDEWIEARLGCVTASCFSEVLAKGEGITRKKYMRKIVAERLTGKPSDSFFNRDMERGKEQEPLARLAYEARTGNFVEEVGFIKHPTLLVGSSPDGLVDKDGGTEIKCVKPTVQIETIERGSCPYEHSAQVQGNLWITGRKWWDYISYSPDLPEPLNLCIFRVERNEEYIKKLEEEVIKFLTEAEELHQLVIRRAA